jgi:hypothetical protein
VVEGLLEDEAQALILPHSHFPSQKALNTRVPRFSSCNGSF